MNIGSKIKELRELNNKTQLDIAKALGVTYQTIYKYEKGIAIPPADALLKLADYFNISVDELLGRTEVQNTVNEIDKKLKDNNIHIAANSRVDIGKLAKLDDKQAKIINNLIDDFLEDEE